MINNRRWRGCVLRVQIVSALAATTRMKNGVTEMVRRLISYLGVGDLVGRFSGGSSTCRFIPLALILARQPFTL
jgi:hypothetical protein